MIRSFRCKETEKLFHGRFSAKLPQAIQLVAVKKLNMLYAAQTWMTYAYRPRIAWKPYIATVLDSTASVSTINGEFALFGIKAKPNRSKLWTITKEPYL